MLEKATKGNVIARECDDVADEWEVVTLEDEPWFIADFHGGADSVDAEQNAKLYATLRNEAPALLAEVEKLRAALREIASLDGNMPSDDAAFRSVSIASQALGETK